LKNIKHTDDHLQEEKVEEGGWNDPAGFHLIPLPFADDIRAAPIEEATRGISIYLSRPPANLIAFFTTASDEIKDAARAWIDKLCVKTGAYPPDSYPNPGKYIQSPRHF
jgi:ATP-dependent DNA helicase 2 subunit 1